MSEATAQLEALDSQKGTETGAEKGSDKRRDARLPREIAIIVSGADALAQPFHESVKTSSISCYGCKFRSKNYVPKGYVVTVEIPPNASRATTRVVHGRVIWVQRPRKYRDLYQVSLEFDIPGNVWGVSDPPASWFAHPKDEKPAAPPVAEPPVTALLVIAQPAPPLEIAPPVVDTLPAVSAVPASTQQAGVALAEEVPSAREHLDENIEAAIARTVKAIAERVAGAAVEGIVREATERATAAIDKARQDSHAAAEGLAAKIRRALDHVLGDHALGDQILGDQALGEHHAGEQHGGAPPATPKLNRAARRRRKHDSAV